MVICSEYCYPCCSHCIYVVKELRQNDKKTYTVNVACSKHPNSGYHISMVLGDGYCKDFICKNTEIENK